MRVLFILIMTLFPKKLCFCSQSPAAIPITEEIAVEANAMINVTLTALCTAGLEKTPLIQTSMISCRYRR